MNAPSFVGVASHFGGILGSSDHLRLAQGEFPQALDAYVRAKTITDRLAARTPEHLQWQRDLGISWDRIGDIHQAEGDFEQAIHAYTEAMKIAERLA